LLTVKGVSRKARKGRQENPKPRLAFGFKTEKILIQGSLCELCEKYSCPFEQKLIYN